MGLRWMDLTKFGSLAYRTNGNYIFSVPQQNQSLSTEPKPGRERQRWKNNLMVHTLNAACCTNKSWQNHSTRKELYGNIPLFCDSICCQRLRFAGHCWRNKAERAGDILLWNPTHGKKVAWTAKNNIHWQHHRGNWL